MQMGGEENGKRKRETFLSAASSFFNTHTHTHALKPSFISSVSPAAYFLHLPFPGEELWLVQFGGFTCNPAHFLLSSVCIASLTGKVRDTNRAFLEGRVAARRGVVSQTEGYWESLRRR